MGMSVKGECEGGECECEGCECECEGCGCEGSECEGECEGCECDAALTLTPSRPSRPFWTTSRTVTPVTVSARPPGGSTCWTDQSESAIARMQIPRVIPRGEISGLLFTSRMWGSSVTPHINTRMQMISTIVDHNINAYRA